MVPKKRFYRSKLNFGQKKSKFLREKFWRYTVGKRVKGRKMWFLNSFRNLWELNPHPSIQSFCIEEKSRIDACGLTCVTDPAACVLAYGLNSVTTLLNYSEKELRTKMVWIIPTVTKKGWKLNLWKFFCHATAAATNHFWVNNEPTVLPNCR